jgi:hypothetical protein
MIGRREFITLLGGGGGGVAARGARAATVRPQKLGRLAVLPRLLA